MSCLFDSLASFLPHKTSIDLRNEICDFLNTNPKLLDELSAEEVIKYESDISLDQYVKRMRQYSSMGGATEIKAFCMLYNKNVAVKSLPNKKIIKFIANPEFSFVYIMWNGGHFDPITEAQLS